MAPAQSFGQLLLELRAQQPVRHVVGREPLGVEETVKPSEGRRGARDRSGGVGAQQLAQVAVDVRAVGQPLRVAKESLQVVAVGGHGVPGDLQLGAEVD